MKKEKIIENKAQENWPSYFNQTDKNWFNYKDRKKILELSNYRFKAILSMPDLS